MAELKERDNTDEYLKRLGQGDSSALEELYDKTSGALYNLCFSYFRNQPDSEDALTDTYLTAVRQISKFRGSKGFNWLYTIAKNICLNKLKKNNRVISVDFTDEKTLNALDVADGASVGYPTGESEIVSVAKKVLNNREFRILTLHAVNELKFREIAQVLGGLESTVRWQYANAIRKVKAAYERSDGI